ncbi:Cytochrome c [Tistlia consotensis]|uniref:Cytochrome c n=1 Tax=Tistlia consotensis USBA 355 TaxID=560819 RepID=A0A1Y6BTU5_9PROT|nr:c-type cytochrome [Tistlia consotensis]SMF27614.1 Cytochrome c [Tistlia consotensis USBA 355]SNR65935.1 Cytochrome c [Tistlia consotensis]
MKITPMSVLAAALALLASPVEPAHAAGDTQMGGQGSGMMGQGMTGQGSGMQGQGMTGQGMTGQGKMAPGLMMPNMDPSRGRQLFASKGCVVCHSINGVGGEDAPALDASTMTMPMNPFEFSARMWDGAEAMVAMQREELGEPIHLTGQELADIIAFVHNEAEQKRFSKDDIPPRIKKLMEKDE